MKEDQQTACSVEVYEQKSSEVRDSALEVWEIPMVNYQKPIKGEELPHIRCLMAVILGE